MLFSSYLDTSLSIVNIFIILQVTVEALRDVKVKIPPAVRRGEKAVLRCSYDMEGDSLYAVKWYKRGREFYRYTPKENPAMKVFGTIGFKIERHTSNESQLTLDSVQPAASGRYSCEVSADAPSFHTLIGSGELDVVETPSQKPLIYGFRSRYRVGDSVRGNCSSRHSKPAANLTWFINDHEANPAHVKYHRPLKDSRNDLETSVAGIQFVVSEHHFQRGKLKIRCRSYIHDIYSQSTEKSFEIDRHKISSPSSSSSSSANSVNIVQNIPYDQFSLQDGDIIDKKDSFMTHIQGDVSSLNAGGAENLTSSLLLILFLFQLPLLVVLNFSQHHHEQQQQQQHPQQQQYQQQQQQELFNTRKNMTNALSS